MTSPLSCEFYPGVCPPAAPALPKASRRCSVLTLEAAPCCPALRPTWTARACLLLTPEAPRPFSLPGPPARAHHQGHPGEQATAARRPPEPPGAHSPHHCPSRARPASSAAGPRPGREPCRSPRFQAHVRPPRRLCLPPGHTHSCRSRPWLRKGGGWGSPQPRARGPSRGGHGGWGSPGGHGAAGAPSRGGEGRAGLSREATAQLLGGHAVWGPPGGGHGRRGTSWEATGRGTPSREGPLLPALTRATLTPAAPTCQLGVHSRWGADNEDPARPALTPRKAGPSDSLGSLCPCSSPSLSPGLHPRNPGGGGPCTHTPGGRGMDAEASRRPASAVRPEDPGVQSRKGSPTAQVVAWVCRPAV